MRIVQLTPAFWPHRGGVERHVLELSRELQQRGHQVLVITYGSAGWQEIEGITVYGLDEAHRDKKWATWRALSKVLPELKAADVVHVHDVAWWLWPWFRQVSYFITFHGWETVWPIPFKSKLLRWVAARCAKASIHIGDWIQEFYWDRPHQSIYGGTVKGLKKGHSPRLEPSSHLHIAFVGRLSQDNQLDWYFKLLHLLRQHYQVTVTWVGDGPAAKSAEHWGRVMGMVDSPKKYLESADIVFANSYLTLLEAQSLGKLVVAATAHPLKKRYIETYPGARWLLSSDTPEKIVEQLLTVSKQEISHMLTEESKWANTQTWSKVSEVYLNLWRRYA